MKPELKSKSPAAAGESGFSLLAVMVAAGVLCFAVFAVARSLDLANRAKKLVRAGAAAADVEHAFGRAVYEKAQQLAAAHCSSSFAAALASLPAGDDGAWEIFRAGRPAAFGALVPGAPAEHTAAYQRCRGSNPTLPATGRGTNVCFSLKPTGATSHLTSDSLLRAQYAFAEVHVNLLNPQVGGGVGCNAFNASVDDVELYYTIYYAHKNGTTTYTFKQSSRYQIGG